MAENKMTWLLAVWIVGAAGYLIGVIYFPTPWLSAHFVDVLLFAVLAVLVAMFPIKMKNSSVVLFQGVSLATFLQFGLLAEILVTQLAVLSSLVLLRVKKSESYRYLVNSVMFLCTSTSAAAMYWIAGGSLTPVMEGSLSLQLIPVLIYFSTYTIFNHSFIYVFRNFVLHRPVPYLTKDFYWELTLSGLKVPFGLILVFLFNEVGTVALFYVGLPFLTLALMLKLYYQADETSIYLEKVNMIGYELSTSLYETQIVQLFSKKIRELFPVDILQIYDVKDNVLSIYWADRFDKNHLPCSLIEGDTISEAVLKTRQSLLYTNASEWKENILTEQFEECEAVISVPMYRGGELGGVLTLASKEAHAFKSDHVSIAEFLANYLNVAIDNARFYEQVKEESETCALTQLYNYRYLEEALHNKFMQARAFKQYLTVLLLDVDHFKAINDHYGHEKGNIILRELALLLQKESPDHALVARYGGEEFAVILEDTNECEAIATAEQLRQKIAHTSFTIASDLTTNVEEVSVTASIGLITTIPDDDHPLSLLRKADRAMYIGAKQAGRNKVSVFGSLEHV
ncbi:sensor domain-containing diguanylate cyclase [Salsuginibacillus kocurii]|uniref:sensor domain-containing diguanylate cyclase n=1 Tax=Salsuginibacillus kocurii TaxID=427078 RepID=UPI00036ED25A|nr:sensor domain-containing diguanylate cyclase [Salsuginibacillus kocurii]